MTTRKARWIFSFALFAVLGLLLSCDSDENKVVCETGTVKLETSFSIKNERATPLTVSLDTVHFYQEPTSFTGADFDTAQTSTIAAGEQKTITAQQGIHPASGGVLSARLTIGGKSYAGWKKADENNAMNVPAETYEFGYLYANAPFPPQVRSCLAPKTTEPGKDRSQAFYTVTVSDTGVSFELTKLVNQTEAFSESPAE